VRDSPLRTTVVLDIDADGRLVGVEVFDATVGLPQEALTEAERIDAD
jgi:uncharacterized protein YuzE